MPDDIRMMTCETCGGDGSFDRVVGHDPDGPVWQDSACPDCQGAGEYAVTVEPVGVDDDQCA